MRPRIVVAGSLNMDIVCEVARAPEAGETLLGRRATFVPGGKGANQAVAAARLGGRVAMLGRVGADAFGLRLRHGLELEGIDTTHLGEDAELATGIALILVDDAAQNRITVVAGANAALTPQHIERAAGLLDGAALLLVQLETPLTSVERAMTEARRRGVPVLLNPAPAQQLPPHWYALADYLVPNETEAGLLTGRPVRDGREAEVAARHLQGHGARRVLITLGAQGVLLLDDDGARLVPAPTVAAVDTTAAGDTFIGALAVGLGEGSSLDAAAGFAARAAALSVTRRGAQTSIPHRTELL